MSSLAPHFTVCSFLMLCLSKAPQPPCNHIRRLLCVQQSIRPNLSIHTSEKHVYSFKTMADLERG